MVMCSSETSFPIHNHMTSSEETFSFQP